MVLRAQTVVTFDYSVYIFVWSNTGTAILINQRFYQKYYYTNRNFLFPDWLTKIEVVKTVKTVWIFFSSTLPPEFLIACDNSNCSSPVWQIYAPANLIWEHIISSLNSTLLLCGVYQKGYTIFSVSDHPELHAQVPAQDLSCKESRREERPS